MEKRVLIAIMPLPLFFLIAHISFSEGTTIRELNISVIFFVHDYFGMYFLSVHLFFSKTLS